MEDPSKTMKNARHEAFCLGYCGDTRHNGAASYLAAGFRCKSADQAKRLASRLLKRPDVAARVRHLEEELAEAERLKALDALRILRAVATVNFSDFLDERGNVDPQKLKDPELRAAVASADPVTTKDGAIIGYKLRLKDSLKALELLGLTAQPQAEADCPQVLVIKA